MKPTKAEVADATVLLCGTGWLGGIAADFREQLLPRCQWQCFAADETISHGGDTTGGMFGLA